jgi:hypothetical protein
VWNGFLLQVIRKENYKKGGLLTASLDAMLNVTNVFAGYDPVRKWQTAALCESRGDDPIL